MADVVMPRLSDTMQEGTILRWLKEDGDEVARGDELVEIETDKASMVYESDLSGLLEILASEGETLQVGEVIAHIGGNGAAPAAATAAPGVEEAEGAEGAALEGPPDGSRGADPGAAPAPAPPAPPAPEPAIAGQGDAGDPGERVKVSPLARRIARERGVDLSAVKGTGPAGRIVRTDVERSAPTAPSEQVGTPMAPLAPGDGDATVSTAKGATTTVELTRTQQTIARRMAESKATIPDFSLQMEVDMEACVALRSELVRLARSGDGDSPAAPTYNDMVVKACALTLREQPRVNSSYRDGRVQVHGRVNVGVAVATDDALVVPTVFDADGKALGEIARETHALVARVRSGEITPPELGGGTFTVSNLGMLGASSFTAIINPPQAAILTVGALERRPVAGEDGATGSAPQIVARAMLTLTLVCDHRVLYGADAARFAGRVRELLQAPAALTL